MKKYLLGTVAVVGLSIACSTASAASIWPIHVTGEGYSESQAWQHANSQANATCAAMGGTVINVEMVSIDRSMPRIWLISILALCEVP